MSKAFREAASAVVRNHDDDHTAQATRREVAVAALQEPMDALQQAITKVLAEHPQLQKSEIPVSELQELGGAHFLLGGEPVFPYALIPVPTESRHILLFSDRPEARVPDMKGVVGSVLIGHIREAHSEEARRDLGGQQRCTTLTIVLLELLYSENGDLHFGPSTVNRAYPHLLD